jgi:hypothetical protein
VFDRLTHKCNLDVEERYVYSYSYHQKKPLSHTEEALIVALAPLSRLFTRSVIPGLKQNDDPIWKFLRARFIEFKSWLKNRRNNDNDDQPDSNSDQDNGSNNTNARKGDEEAGGEDPTPANVYQQPTNDNTSNSEDPESRDGENTDKLRPIDPPVHFIARFIVALIAASLLVAPVAVLSWQSARRAHLITLSVSTTIFSFLASFSSKSSLQETMVAVAGYTAVLVVFVAVASTG